MRFSYLAVLVAAACSAACSRQDGNDNSSAGAQPAAAQPSPAGDGKLVAGTPAGDLEDWLADMRKELTEIRQLAKSDRKAAQSRVLTLYVGRQEYLEMYYGPGGRMTPPARLAAAVKLNEDRFHELMRVSSVQPPPPLSEVESAIDGVEKQIGVVVDAAMEATRRIRAGQPK